MVVDNVKFRKYAKPIAALSAMVILVLLGGQWYLENKIESFLAKKLPDGYALTYENLNVNLLLRKVQLTNIDGFYKSTSNKRKC